jgi:hypothetical protein
MSSIKIRFNTKNEDPTYPSLKWRVIIDGTDFFASNVYVNVPLWTSEDTVQDKLEVVTKWHLSCIGTPNWEGTELTIC